MNQNRHEAGHGIEIQISFFGNTLGKVFAPMFQKHPHGPHVALHHDPPGDAAERR